MHFAVPRLPAVLIAIVLAALVAALGADAADAAEVHGAAFKDLNRDGIMQPLEEPLVGKEIYAFDSTGRAPVSRRRAGMARQP